MGRICRICGGLLLKKDGTYSQGKRFCGRCDSTYFKRYYWNCVRESYLLHLIKYQKNNYAEIKDMNKRKRSVYTQKFYCENCKKLIKSSECELHHIIPVYKLNENNYNLCWDLSNLIALCKTCHKLQKKDSDSSL